MKLRFLILGVLAAMALALPATAQASSCRIGGSGYTFNRAGDLARFRSLTPMRGMNCASARYVMNRWLRRSFARSWFARLPVRFFDGYVTWHCHRRTRLRWQCNERTSGTAFRFTAYLVN